MTDWLAWPSPAQLWMLGGSAVAVFWMLGAYNRLVALRTAVGAAWTLVDEVLQRRGAALLALEAALRTPLAAETGSLDALAAAQAQVRAAAEGLAQRPLDPACAAQLVAAEAQMTSAASRVLALLELGATELRAQPAVAGPVAVLRDSPARLVFSRQIYNEAAAAYDAALREFPTRLLRRLFGFAPAGRL